MAEIQAAVEPVVEGQAGSDGGIYYFDSAQSLQQFLASQLAADVQGHRAVSEFSAKTFEILDTVTAVTRGPVQQAVVS